MLYSLSEEEVYQNVISNQNFLLFRRGDFEMIMRLGKLRRSLSQKTFGGASLHPHEYFATEMALSRENVRSLFRGYLRSHLHKDYIVAPPSKYPQLQDLTSLIPVLHYSDGQNNHFLLKRRSDKIFDLIVLEFSNIFQQYSGKSIETFPVKEYIINARLANATKLKISMYKDGSYKLPESSHLEIPLESLDIHKWLAARKEDQEREYQLMIAERGGGITREEDALRKSNQKIKSLLDLVQASKKQEEQLLKEKVELVTMRLPYMKEKLLAAKTLEEVTILVQGEIISKVFDPEPMLENCPGEIKQDGKCYPTGNWDQKTWDLYRQLYRIPDIASAFYYNY